MIPCEAQIADAGAVRHRGIANQDEIISYPLRNKDNTIIPTIPTVECSSGSSEIESNFDSDSETESDAECPVDAIVIRTIQAEFRKKLSEYEAEDIERFKHVLCEQHNATAERRRLASLAECPSLEAALCVYTYQIMVIRHQHFVYMR